MQDIELTPEDYKESTKPRVKDIVKYKNKKIKLFR